ncbi:MAG: hypothetical protein KJZ75_08210 [Hyphomonadaceae bacterium]|nr:hypothetical protein [Hyphomonadaceae bacterium]
MADVTKRFRWGPSFENILDHFTTPEIEALRRKCRKLIRDFCDLELEGEGYRCAVIPFEMFHYGFVLAYSFVEEEWALEVLAAPDFGAPDCLRKRPRRRKDGGARREALIAAWRDVCAWRSAGLTVLYNFVRRIGPALTAFRADEGTMRAFAAPTHEIPSPIGDSVAASIRFFNAFAEQQSQGCRNLVQLLRSTASEAVWFLGPLSSFAGRGPAEELWDASLFGGAEQTGG